MYWEAVPETIISLTVKLYLHKSYLGRYVHNFSGLTADECIEKFYTLWVNPGVVLLKLRCKMLGKVGFAR